ncbi:MAG: hypothetical protein ABI551_24110 [Polyangiaceae bacterium]
MKVFGPKRIDCPAAVWTTIVATSFAQFPKSWTVRFEGDVDGECELKKSSWIFPGAPVVGALAARMTFERGYWNTFFSVRVRPRTQAIVAIVE